MYIRGFVPLSSDVAWGTIMDATLKPFILNASPDVPSDPPAPVVEMSGLRERMLRDLEQFLSMELVGGDWARRRSLRKPSVRTSET